MANYLIDRRDLDFVMFEHLRIQDLCAFEPYQDYGVEDFRAVMDNAQKLATEVLAPTAKPADDLGCKLENGNVVVPEIFRDAWKQFAEGGWIAVSRSPDFGGMGLPSPLAVFVSELKMGAATSFSFFSGLTTGAGHLLEAYADDDLKNVILPRFYGGQWMGTMCLTEPQAGTSVGDLSTAAFPIEGNDRQYKIQGNKIFISAGDHDIAENIVHLVLARVPGDPPGTKGISLFAVPKFRFDLDGNLAGPNDVKTTAIEHKMGINGSPTCSLAFGDNDDCIGWLIGKRTEGIVYMFQMMNEARISCGIQGVAAANEAYQLSLAYAKERIQSRKVTAPKDSDPVAIIEHPDVRRNLMLAKSYSEGIRALLYGTSFVAERARHATDANVKRNNQMLLELLTPICKAYATDIGFKVTELAIQIHGGYGYIREYGVEQLMRDVKIASIYEGTNGVQALDLLGRKMRMHDGAAFMAWMQQINELAEAHKGHPRLADLVEAVDKAKNSLGGVAMGFGQQAKQDPELPLLGATPFLEMFGHVEVARLLVEQALVADEKLRNIMSEKGVSDSGLRDLIADHDDARFYDAKVKTARFFVSSVLPQAVALGKAISSADRSALDIVF